MWNKTNWQRALLVYDRSSEEESHNECDWLSGKVFARASIHPMREKQELMTSREAPEDLHQANSCEEDEDEG